MNDVWAPVISGLGAAILTGGFGFGLEWRRDRRSVLASQMAARRECYGRLLLAAGLVAYTAQGFRITKFLRSGLVEGIDVATRIRKPADSLEVMRELRVDYEALSSAWGDVWATGTPEAVLSANRLVDACGDLMGGISDPATGRTRLTKFVLGEKPTEEEEEEWTKRLRATGEARRAFADLVRRETGLRPVNLTDLA